MDHMPLTLQVQLNKHFECYANTIWKRYDETISSWSVIGQSHIMIRIHEHNAVIITNIMRTWAMSNEVWMTKEGWRTGCKQGSNQWLLAGEATLQCHVVFVHPHAFEVWNLKSRTEMQPETPRYSVHPVKCTPAHSVLRGSISVKCCRQRLWEVKRLGLNRGPNSSFYFLAKLKTNSIEQSWWKNNSNPVIQNVSCENNRRITVNEQTNRNSDH